MTGYPEYLICDFDATLNFKAFILSLKLLCPYTFITSGISFLSIIKFLMVCKKTQYIYQAEYCPLKMIPLKKWLKRGFCTLNGRGCVKKSEKKIVSNRYHSLLKQLGNSDQLSRGET